MSYRLIKGSQQNRSLWGISSNNDIYMQLVCNEIVEMLGGQAVSGIATLGQNASSVAISTIASAIGMVAPGTEAAITAFINTIGPEKFFYWLGQAASGGISPAPDLMIFGDDSLGTPVGVFSRDAQIRIGSKTYQVQALDPTELSGLLTWMVGVPNINWIGSWQEVVISLTGPAPSRDLSNTGLVTPGSETSGIAPSTGNQSASPAPEINRGIVVAGAALLLLFLVLPNRK